jgi:hypothetical protein
MICFGSFGLRLSPLGRLNNEKMKIFYFQFTYIPYSVIPPKPGTPKGIKLRRKARRPGRAEPPLHVVLPSPLGYDIQLREASPNPSP